LYYIVQYSQHSTRWATATKLVLMRSYTDSFWLFIWCWYCLSL